MNMIRNNGRVYAVALRALLLFTLVLGVAYPLVVTAIGQFAFPYQANGSLVSYQGRNVGSEEIGQSFSDAQGHPLAQYFQPRPSVAGNGYDPKASGGSNLGPENPELINTVQERKAEIAIFNGVPPETVPVDAVTASASGLDPHISKEYALLQVPRVARARNIPEDQLTSLVETRIQDRSVGFMGEQTVNVLTLNIALDELEE